MKVVDVIDSTVAVGAMHPDCLLVQQHVGIKSPRLSSSTIDLVLATREKTFNKKISSVKNSSDTKMMALNEQRFDDDEEEDEERLQISNDEAMAEPEDDASDIDALSICSEDSELSVGCENALAAEEASSPIMKPSHYNGNVRDAVNLSGPKKLLSDVKLDSSEQVNPSVMHPFVMANALQIPVPVVLRSQTTPFQEEFLRKSHLYAEELVKQQMQIMAAARANALQLRNAGMSMNMESDGKSKFNALSQLSAISKMSQLAAAAVAAANTKHVHSQADLHRATEATLNAYAAESQRFSSQMPGASSLQQLQVQMQAHWPYMQDTQSANNANADNNENMQEPALKFSIDNILKADFGRRINESLMNIERERERERENINNMRNAELHCLATANKKHHGTSSQKHLKHLKESAAAASPAPMDLTSLMNNATTTATGNTGTLNFCNTLANICTNSNDSSNTVLSSNAGGSVDSSIGGSVKSPSDNNMHKQQHHDSNNKNSDTNNSSNGTNSTSSTSSTNTGNGPIVWPAWVYCTRYSDRPSSGRSPRTRKPKKSPSEKGVAPVVTEDKRPRTAFSGSQLARLKNEFTENRYLTEKRRQQLSSELGLNEAQIKIWFQNKRAKLKKSSGTKNPLALQLMAQGLYNHSTVPLTREEEEMQELQERENAAAEAAANASCNSLKA